jgi:hypothetical protein
VASYRHVALGRAIATAVTEKIDDNYAMALGNERNNLSPQVRRGRETMEKYDRLAGPASPGSVVVEPRSVYVDELSPHGLERPTTALSPGSASMVVLVEFTWQDGPPRA